MLGKVSLFLNLAWADFEVQLTNKKSNAKNNNSLFISIYEQFKISSYNILINIFYHLNVFKYFNIMRIFIMIIPFKPV